jgi:hypothetical protein
MTARLIRIDWPDNGQPQMPPDPTLAEMAGRLAAVRALKLTSHVSCSGFMPKVVRCS